MKKITDAVRLFEVLSVETRVRIIALLKQKPLCVNALARALKMTPAAVSQHLRVLRNVGIVIGAKHGYYVHYRVDNKKLFMWVKNASRLLLSNH